MSLPGAAENHAPTRQPDLGRLGWGLIVLGSAMASTAVLGPLVSGMIVYRTSPTSLNQILGVDATVLCVAAPVSVVLGVLVVRGRHDLVPLGTAPAVFAAYSYPQLAVGNEFLHRPGNVERFFPLLAAVFVLAMAVAIGIWTATSYDEAPPGSPRADRVAGVTLLAIAVFVVAGLHLPGYLDAISAHPTTVGYLTSPTAFWLVKFMDLGIVVPAAVAVGVGMLRRRAWARRPMYAIVGGYALLGISVAVMAVVMWLTGDSDGSLGMVLTSGIAASALVTLAGYLYRPLLVRRGAGTFVPRGHAGRPCARASSRREP
jgi:hypothetical protein